MAASSIKMGMLLVMFDLPVVTDKERKIATLFRKRLLEDGYSMLQYSVYMRTCVSWERMQKHRLRLQFFAPSGGNIKGFFITDKQWQRAITIAGKDEVVLPTKTVEQPDIFALDQFW